MVKCVRASYDGHSVFVVCFFRPGMQNQSIVLDRSSLFDQNHLIRSTLLLLMYLFYFFFFILDLSHYLVSIVVIQVRLSE